MVSNSLLLWLRDTSRLGAALGVTAKELSNTLGLAPGGRTHLDALDALVRTTTQNPEFAQRVALPNSTGGVATPSALCALPLSHPTKEAAVPASGGGRG
jgi:hypothetical protein